MQMPRRKARCAGQPRSIARHARQGAGERAKARRASALLVVLVVVTLLSLAAYTFSELMVAESRASRQYYRDAQSRELANSAVEYVAAWLGSPVVDEGQTPNYYHNAAVFAGVQVVTSDLAEGQGWFTVVAPVESDTLAGSVRFGLMNESARLNVNAIVNYEVDEDTQRMMLLGIPGMTEELADKILDWIDTDDTPRAYGAESDTYQGMVPPYDARNGPLDSIDELLLVEGVTPELLYGEDANRNGLLDPNENDGEVSLPLDNADGILDVGWASYLTVSSRESNLRPDASSKIDINQGVLTELYDQIDEEFGEDLAVFITAYRLYGATNVEPLETSTTGSSNSSTTGNAQTDTALNNLATSVARAITGGNQGSVTRGGLDLSTGATTDVASLFELLGAEVEAQVNGQPTTLTSPFTASSESLQLLLENFTTNSATSIDGRININEARQEVLMGIPGMPTDLPGAIVAARPVTRDGAPVDDVLAQRSNTGWLLLEGLADVTTMRMIDQYVTTGGQIYRMQAVGRFTGNGPTARVEAIIDATEDLPKVIYRRDLSDLGAGYRSDLLRPADSTGMGTTTGAGTTTGTGSSTGTGSGTGAGMSSGTSSSSAAK